MTKELDKPKEQGSNVHAQLEHRKGEWWEEFNMLCSEQRWKVVWQERIFVGQNYAGKPDILLFSGDEYLLGDFKGQVWEKDSKPNIYPDWTYQLAAYLQLLGEPIRCVSIVYHREDPKMWHIHNWRREDIDKGLMIFNNLKSIWMLMKNYKLESVA